ncbi:MAG: hypothetical protein MUF15_12405 [Acidobacteria bacterium]|nr:hypothetical protein [Acidobacteriota bacterium]
MSGRSLYNFLDFSALNFVKTANISFSSLVSIRHSDPSFAVSREAYCCPKLATTLPSLEISHLALISRFIVVCACSHIFGTSCVDLLSLGISFHEAEFAITTEVKTGIIARPSDLIILLIFFLNPSFNEVCSKADNSGWFNLAD